MDDFRDMTTKKFVPSDYCSDGCCKGLKWCCKPKYCYPILAQRIFSCAVLKSVTLSSILRDAEFITEKLPFKLMGEKVCIKDILGVEYKCLGLKDETLVEYFDTEDLDFKPAGGPVCTCRGVDLYDEYISKMKFKKDFSIADVCNHEECDNDPEGIKIKVYHDNVEYYVCNFKVIVEAYLKDDPNNTFKAVFKLPGLTKLSDPTETDGLGLPAPYFYGNLCVPFERDSKIYKVFDGKFKADCVTRASDLMGFIRSDAEEEEEKLEKFGKRRYRFTADIVLCFCPKETVYTIIKDVIGVNGTLDLECHCDVSKPCAHGCCDDHHHRPDPKPCGCGSHEKHDELDD